MFSLLLLLLTTICAAKNNSDSKGSPQTAVRYVIRLFVLSFFQSFSSLFQWGRDGRAVKAELNAIFTAT